MFIPVLIILHLPHHRDLLSVLMFPLDHNTQAPLPNAFSRVWCQKAEEEGQVVSSMFPLCFKAPSLTVAV